MRILRGLGSRSLRCECFVGVYETYDGDTIEIIEERGRRCGDRSHKAGKVTIVSQDTKHSIAERASA